MIAEPRDLLSHPCQSTSSRIPVQPTPAPQPLPDGASDRLQVPQFGGSPVGFWVLIVSLALIVIVCSIAIFWLLKHHEPTPAERARRRAKRDAEKAQAEAVSTSEYPSDPRSFKERIGRFFGRGGWTKADDDIEVQNKSLDNSGWRAERYQEESDPPYATTARSGYGGVPSDQPHEYHRDTRMSSTSTVQLSAPSSDHTPIISRGVDLPFEPPYRSESPQSDLSYASSEASMYERPRQDERSFSVMSGDQTASMRKLDNGTKFMEQI